MKRGITPVVAVILLIVMTVGIAAFTFMWMQQFFERLKSGAESTIETVEKTPQFQITYAGFTKNDKITFIVYNLGEVPIDLENAQYILIVTDKIYGNSSYHVQDANGLGLSCDTSEIVYPGKSESCTITSTAFDTSVTRDNLSRYSYSLEIVYQGVRTSYVIS